DLRGMVTTEDGKPCAGATVVALRQAQRSDRSRTIRESVKTDAQGKFALKGLPRSDTAYVLATAEGACSDALVLARPDDATPTPLHRRREKPRPRAGPRVDALAKPVVDALVRLWARARTPLRVTETWTPGSIEQWNLRTDQDGRFEPPRRLRTTDEHSVLVIA